MKLTLNMGGVAATAGGGSALPEGAHRAKIQSIEVAANKAGTGDNLVVSFATDAGGSKAWFPVPNGGKNDEFFTGKIKHLLLSVGVPAAALEATISIDTNEIVGKALVVFVQDRAPADDGKRQYDIVPVLPEDAAAALAGQWTPSGGRTATTTTAPANGSTGLSLTPPPKDESVGGGLLSLFPPS